MPTLRFSNPVLHERFVELLTANGYSKFVDADGTIRCDDTNWLSINNIAHQIRDSCFLWYFSWLETTQSAREFQAYLRDNNFRFELEEHEDRLVFLLPKADRESYNYWDAEPLIHKECSFCAKSYTEVKCFFASDSAAICGACVTWMYSDMVGEEPEKSDA